MADKTATDSAKDTVLSILGRTNKIGKDNAGSVALATPVLILGGLWWLGRKVARAVTSSK